LGDDALRFLQFCVVGTSGLLVNTLVLALATDMLELHYLVSAILATQISTLWNFMFTEFWVFSDRPQRWGRVHRLTIFLLMNNAALGLRGPLMFTLTSGLGIHYVTSNLISLMALTFLRYALAETWIWGRTQPEKFSPDYYDQDSAGSRLNLGWSSNGRK
jgi:dolichol-phosphate mannosyltransferase